MIKTIIPNSPSGQGGKTDLPAKITKAGSKQTYYTFRFLTDRDRVQDAYRAYAYFRWLDDLLDCNSGTKQEKVALINRQQALLEACYQGKPPGDVSPEEQMLVDLVGNDKEKHSGLQIYLRNMMAVMSFDVERCGRVISHAELNRVYAYCLSTAVTEYCFILSAIRMPLPVLKPAIMQCMVRMWCICCEIWWMISPQGYFNIPGEYHQSRANFIGRFTQPLIPKVGFRESEAGPPIF